MSKRFINVPTDKNPLIHELNASRTPSPEEASPRSGCHSIVGATNSSSSRGEISS